MSTHTTNQEAVETVKKLIDKIETAMLTTISAEGLVSRPMQTQDIEFDGDLWFLTSKETDKYQELLKNPSVNVAYIDKSYVSIRGTAELVEDIERKKSSGAHVTKHILERHTKIRKSS